MTDFLVPTALELRQVEQDLLPNLMADRLIFQYFPIRETDQSFISWEQMDNYLGLQNLRGIDGSPTKVQRTGAKRYVSQPGIYGEFTACDEQEITQRRRYGTFDQLIDISDLVAIEQQRLLQRRLDRIEQIGWTLLSTGTFSVASDTGILHTDTYTMQTFSASVPWSTHATSTPLADLRAIQLLQRGHSVRFDSSSQFVTNRKTANHLFSNTNADDLYGRRTTGLGTFNSPAQINDLFTGDDLPTLSVYDQGYLNDSGTFVPYIADGLGVLVGKRTNNVPVAEYVMTRNANNPGLAPGSYTKVIDRGENTVPRSVEVHDGHNGGPTISFPSAVVVMSNLV